MVFTMAEERGKVVLDEEDMDDEELKTNVDQLLELLKTQEKIPLEEAAEELGVELDVVQSWVDFLVEEQIVGIEYKFTKPYIYLNQPEPEEKEEEDEGPQDFEAIKEDFLEKAAEKDIPAQNRKNLWQNRVEKVLDKKEEYFKRQAKRRGLENVDQMWEQYKKKLLGNNMKLEKFIEEDMEEFLERKAEEKTREESEVPNEEMDVSTFSRDYAEEVSEKLDKGDLEQARQVYLDLKKEYNSFPEGSADQRAAHSIMEEIRGKVQSYLDSVPDSEGLPDSAEEVGIEVPEKPEPRSFEEKREQQIQKLKRQKQKKDRLVQDIRKYIDRMENLLDEGNVVAAMVLYRYVKDSFRKIPKRFEDEREELYDEIITAYYQIRKAKDSLSGEDKKKFREQKRKLQREEERSEEGQGNESKQERTQETSTEESKESSQGGTGSQKKSDVGGQAKDSEETPDKPESSPGQEREKRQTASEEAASEAGSGRQVPAGNREDPEKDEPSEFEIEERVRKGAQGGATGDNSSGEITKEHVLEELDKVKEHIRNKEARKAFDKYYETKSKFKELSADEEKEEVMQDLLAVYRSLRDLEKHEVDKKQRPAPQESVLEKEEPSYREKMNKGERKVYSYLDNGEIKSAVVKYNELKKQFDEIPDEKEDVRQRWHDGLMKLHDSIVKARQEKLKRGKGEGSGQESGGSECWDDVQQIKNFLDNGEVNKAKQRFIELQRKMSKVEDEEEKKELYNALDNIKSKIHLASSGQESERRIKT